MPMWNSKPETLLSRIAERRELKKNIKEDMKLINDSKQKVVKALESNPDNFTKNTHVAKSECLFNKILVNDETKMVEVEPVFDKDLQTWRYFQSTKFSNAANFEITLDHRGKYIFEKNPYVCDMTCPLDIPALISAFNYTSPSGLKNLFVSSQNGADNLQELLYCFITKNLALENITPTEEEVLNMKDTVVDIVSSKEQEYGANKEAGNSFKSLLKIQVKSNNSNDEESEDVSQ